MAKRDDILSQENKAKAQARYKADPEKKKASVRDSYNADFESKQSAKRQRYQEDLEENRAAKRQRYQEDVEENRAAKRQRYQEDVEENRSSSSSSSAAPTGSSSSCSTAPTATSSSRSTATSPTTGTSIGISAPTSCHPGHCHHHPHGSHGQNQAAEIRDETGGEEENKAGEPCIQPCDGNVEVKIFTCIPTLSGSILLAGPPSTFIIAVRMVGATKIFPPPPNLVVCQQFRFQAQWGPPGMGQGLDPP
ncbi:hypothetical protein EMCRGX_G033541 [Ephydatia muelleri]